MSPVEPTQTYSKSEIDLKLQNLEQRIDGKLDKILLEMQQGFREVGTEFRNELSHFKNEFNLFKTEVHSEISILKDKFDTQNKLVWAIFLMLLSLIVGAGIKFIL